MIRTIQNNALSVHNKEDTLAKISPYKAMSGKQILDLSVSVADEVTRLFDPIMLYDCIFNVDNYLEGTFLMLVSQAVGNLGMQRELVQGVYEPPFGLKNEHTFELGNLRKGDLGKILQNMVILEEGLFEKTDEKDLVGIEYQIMFPWCPSDNYFDKKLCLQYFQDVFEELKLPKGLAKLVSKIYGLSLKLSGRKEENEIINEIQGLIKKISPEDTHLLDMYGGKYDVFSYKDYTFLFQLGRPIYQEYFYGSPHICWMYVLYNDKPYNKSSKPIGYTFLKSEIKEQKLLGF